VKFCLAKDVKKGGEKMKVRLKRFWWHINGIFIAITEGNTTIEKCPRCEHYNFLFYVSTGDDEAEICWPCWMKTTEDTEEFANRLEEAKRLKISQV